jgi:hypothetical protein
MNARKFDALAMAVTNGAQRASRRKMLRGLAALAVTGLAPGVAQAFDGGVAPVQPPAGSVLCTSGADCAAGEICLNGGCVIRTAVGTGGEPSTGTISGPGASVPGTTPVAVAQTPEPAGVGGLIQPGAPLPARIYSGRCGALGAQPAFQLIDVGSVEGTEQGETPAGALTAIPAEFSTTVVNTTLDQLLAAEHAVDVRVDDADPATSIACGDVGGPVETGADGQELAVGLQERGNSAYSGIAFLQGQGDRTLVRVFLARGLEEGTVSAAQEAAPQTAAPAATEAAPAATETAQVAATPAVTALSPIGPGTSVITTIDVNLRAEPSEDAPVVTILGQGVALEVTGTPSNGWVPVQEPATGQRGFVSDQFVTVA